MKQRLRDLEMISQLTINNGGNSEDEDYYEIVDPDIQGFDFNEVSFDLDADSKD